jgi:hypothetical protein
VPKIELSTIATVWIGVRWEDAAEAVSVSVGWGGGLVVGRVGVVAVEDGIGLV